MSDYTTPRRMVKALLRGETPPRPLLMPIVFSLGARMENLSQQNFLGNPTKITNVLRQIRGVLKVDGLTCYYDPFWEVEALGYTREWRADGSCTVAVPVFSSIDDLRSKLNSPDTLQDKGRIPVACEVLRRAKAILKDEPALMVRVNGPISLAKQLSCGTNDAESSTCSLPEELLELSAEVTASLVKTLAEAGADLILLAEDFRPEPTSARFYSSLLAPIVNVIRFYETLPVLLLGKVSKERFSSLAPTSSDCVLCPTLASHADAQNFARHCKEGIVGCALPISAFCDQADLERLLIWLDGLCDLKPCILTSDEDVVATVDVKQLAKGLKSFREHFGIRPLDN